MDMPTSRACLSSAVIALACGASPSTEGAGGTSSGGSSNGAGGSAGGSPNASGGYVSTGGSVSCVPNVGCKLEAPPSSADLHQDCVDRVNQFRTQCACLPPLARWTEGEACADQMAQYDAERTNPSAAFNAKICSGGGAQNECVAWASATKAVSVCLQEMWNEGPPSTPTCIGACFEEHGHYINMTSTTSSQLACGFYTMSDGKVWSVQNFSR